MYIFDTWCQFIANSWTSILVSRPLVFDVLGGLLPSCMYFQWFCVGVAIEPVLNFGNKTNILNYIITEILFMLLLFGIVK